MKKYTLRGLYMKMAVASLMLTVSGMAQEKTVTYYADPNPAPPDLMVALEHVSADLSFVPAENRVAGTAVLTFRPNRYRTDSIVLITPDFNVFEVNIDSKPCRYRQNGASLIIFPTKDLNRGDRYALFVRYESTPARGPVYFIGWKPEEAGKRKQIWAHRPNGWLPYLEARVTMDIRITFDNAFTVFTNGERVGVRENPDGTRTWHYRMTRDHPYFSTCLAIGDYEYAKSATAHGVPLELLYYRGMEDRVKPTYQYTEQMFEFFGQETGVPYPYPVYREIPVMDYMYGGMETTTATVFGDYMLIDPRAYWQRNYINVNAHELAHQWYGDCIAHLAHKDVWLTESFGTYFAKIFEKSIFGTDQYQAEMHNESVQVMAAAARNDFPVGGSRGGVERIYQKGSLVLGMLRYVMGDREFLDAVRLYTQRSLFTYAETADFIRAVYDATGISYHWFFEEWILKGGEPDYVVEREVLDDSAGTRFTAFNVTQVQPVTALKGLFRMPVVFEVHYTDGTVSRVREMVEEKAEVIRVPNPEKKEIAYALFDPGRNILKKVTFDKPFEEWSVQAMQAANMIDRYDALVAMRTFPVERKRDLLLRVFSRETFHMTRTEIIRQLASDTASGTQDMLVSALTDRDALVRRSVLILVNPLPAGLRMAAESCLADSSYHNVELALEALCRDFPENRKEYLNRTRGETGWRGLNIRMKWLEITIGGGDRNYLQEVIQYTGPSYEFETRINSLNLLWRLDYLDPVAAENLISASLHWNNKLSGAARDVLARFGPQDEKNQIIRTAMENMVLTEKEKTQVMQILSKK